MPKSSGFRWKKASLGVRSPWLQTSWKSIMQTFLPSFYKVVISLWSIFLVHTRRLVGSTDQAYPSCFYFRISWILMEWYWFWFFGSCGFLQGLRSLKHWLLSMNILGRKFRFLINPKRHGGGGIHPLVRRLPAISHRTILWSQNFLTLYINIPSTR
jgi:hypothetical protein